MWYRHSHGHEVQSSLYRAILQDIMSGKVTPGDRLVEEQLARTHRVSRTPIREVLLALQKDGLVDRLRNRGARVSSFTARDVEELYDIRKALEVHCVPKFIQRANLTELLELDHQFETLDGGSGPEWRQVHARLDLELHYLIISKAGNERLKALMGNLSMLVESLQVAGFQSDSLALETGRQHRAIVRAVLDRESETAQRLLADHIEFGKRNTLTLFLRSSMNANDGKVRSGSRKR